MLSVFIKEDEGFKSKFEIVAKKFDIDKEDIRLVFFDKFLFSYVFLAAVANKKLYLFSTDNKKPEQFNMSDLKEIRIDKKTDLNLYLRTGRVINLTSVVGVKPKVLRTFKRLTEELQRLR